MNKIYPNTVLLTTSSRNRALVIAHFNPYTPYKFVLIIGRPGQSKGLLFQHRCDPFNKSLTHSSTSPADFTAPSSPNGQKYCNQL